MLDQKVSFDFKDKTLEEVVQFFSFLNGHTEESFVLDPRDRKTGRLDPKRLVSGSAKDIPLREARPETPRSDRCALHHSE